MTRPPLARLIRPEPALLEAECANLGLPARQPCAQQTALLARVEAGLVRLDDLSPEAIAPLRGLASAKGVWLITVEPPEGTDPLGGSVFSALLAGPHAALVALADALAAGEGTGRLPELGAALRRALGVQGRYRHATGRLGATRIVWGQRALIMGIVNVTPDSFSGDGLLRDVSPSQALDLAVAQSQRLLAEGADLLDVGGESTRPGAAPVDAETEIARVVPVIRALRAGTNAPISVDTAKAAVAEAALLAGADLVNDVWGLQMDARMGPLLAEAGAPVVLMHNRSRPRHVQEQAGLGGRYVDVPYASLMTDLQRDLTALVDGALACGIVEERIIVDPGIGFGKTVAQNLAIINRLDELRALGYPILLGPSRKSFIGYTLDLPPDQRVEGTLAAAVVGLVRGGADILRVHDVLAVARAARMAEAIQHAGGG